MSTGTRVRSAALYAVLVLVVVGVAAVLLDSQVGGLQVYDVYPTNSMLPTLEVGDLVIVHSVPYNSVQVGQVIVFARPFSATSCSTEVIVHRVVNITFQGLYTWGDNRFTNTRPDEPLSWPPVPAICVRGVVVLAIPYLGRISEAFPPPYNYILVGMIVVIIFIIESGVGKDKRRLKRKTVGIHS